MKLRDYQEELYGALRETLKTVKSVVAVASTGFGKTAIAVTMMGTATSRGRRVIFQVHRRALVRQVSNTLKKAGIPHSFIASKYPYDPDAFCHIAIVNTLSRRTKEVAAPALFIIDESHLGSGKMWSTTSQWAKDSGAYVVGLTATPEYPNGRGLGEHFEAMVEGKDAAWLMENGYLNKYRYFAPAGQIDKKNFRIKHGDYDVRQVEAETTKSSLVGSAIENYKKYALGKKAILFAVNIKVSEEVAAAFNAEGIRAAHLDCNSNDDLRVDIIEAFARGEIDVLCNAYIFAEGFDLSSYIDMDVSVEAVILYTATSSRPRFRQMCGRGLRPGDEPTVFIDHGSNYIQHGLPDAPIEWVLHGRAKPQQITQVKQCKVCYYCYIGSNICPSCGATPKVKKRKGIRADDGELVEVVAKSAKELKAEERACVGLKDWHLLAKERNKTPGWAYSQWKWRNERKRDT
jgi:superfamily II DNA or RNA helicase